MTANTANPPTVTLYVEGADDQAADVIEMLIKVLNESPIIGRDETTTQFRERQDRWLREVYLPAIAEARGEA